MNVAVDGFSLKVQENQILALLGTIWPLALCHMMSVSRDVSVIIIIMSYYVT